MQPKRAYEALHHLVDEVMFIVGEARDVLFVSPSVENVLGYSEEQFRAVKTFDLIHPEDLEDAAHTAVALRAAEGASYRSTLRIRHAAGHWVWCEIVGRNLLHTDVGGVVNTLRDISDRRAVEERLLHQAHHDALTGLPNRRWFVEQLEADLANPHACLGVLILDLDGFKQVNDELGHAAGDELLTRFARLVEERLRPGDRVCRIGGDEFAVLCQRVDGPDALERLAERIRGAVHVDGELPSAAGVTVSIGAAVAHAGEGPSSLLRAADESLYEAKRAGRDRVALAVR